VVTKVEVGEKGREWQ